MKLFNPKTLDRHIDPNIEIPDAHRSVLENWRELITSQRINTIKEISLHGDFKSGLVETVLGYKSAVEGAEHTVTSEQNILRGSVDLALGHFGGESDQILAPFELKGAKTKDLDAIMPGRAKSPVQQAWEYATHAPGVKWVLVSNYLEIRLYGFGEGTQAYESFDLARLTEPAEYARFILLLGAENLLTGKTSALLKESRQEDKDITDTLYADYKSLRDTLIDSVARFGSGITPLEAISIGQKILDRVLFTAFAEDTGLLPDSILAQAFEHSDPFNPKPVWDNFKGLFNSIDKGNSALDVPPYNGGLFAPDPQIDTLELPDTVCAGFKRLGEYDFASEISVTVLGHIFEQSITDVEHLQQIARGEVVEEKKASGTSGKRKRDGVVYTPDYIARFIVEQTLGTHLKEIFQTVFSAHTQKGVNIDEYETIKWKNKGSELKAWEAYRDKLKTLRIVDPACGSGVFLVIAFDYMKAELTRVNDKITDLRGGVADLFDPDSEILTNNLFGVDVNSESVEIAKLSLWVKTARRGKVLDSLDDNLKVGDSLIEDSNYAYLEHGFTWKSAFPQVFDGDNGGFDIVLGNPPYVRQELLGSMKPYLESRFEVYHGVADLYCYFFERGLTLLKPGGRLGYISSSTFFKTNSGRPLRDFLRAKGMIETAVDFGDLQIFEGVTTYPVILTIRNQTPTPDHELKFWEVETLPEANFRATFETSKEPYPQNGLTSESWELENPALQALRAKIRQGKKTLKEVYGSPYRGVLTGRNEAFVIDEATKNHLIAEDPKSSEVLKPWLEGKDLKRWRAESRGLSIILFPKGWTIEQFGLGEEPEQWQKLVKRYPAITAHLELFTEVCRKRTDQGDYWWELRACDYYEEFEKPKIVYQDIANTPPFSMDYSNSFLANTTYLLSAGDFSLLGYLNSKLFWFYFKNISAQIRGGYSRLIRQFMDGVILPNTQPNELASLAETCQTAAETRYKLQQGVVRRIPDLCPAEREVKLTTRLKNWWELEDFAAFQKEIKKVFKTEIPLKGRNDWEDWLAKDRAEIARLTAEIKSGEDQINALVYELFELTDEEIILLEASL